MKTRAATVVSLGRVEVREYEVPYPRQGEALVRIEMNGICGTDTHLLWDAEWVRNAAPTVLGHEWVGRLVEMGAGFPRRDVFNQPLEVGDRVFSQSSYCGRCYNCRILMQPLLCTTPLRRLPGPQGAMSEYMLIDGDGVIIKIPQDMPNEIAILLDPLGTALQAVERAMQPGTPDRGQGFGPGKTVAVQGAGAIGLLSLLVAKLSGASLTIMIGAPVSRLEICRHLGADHVIDITSTDSEERVARVRELTPLGMGPDVVIEAAGVPQAFQEGLKMVRPAGVYVEAGHFTHRGTIPIDPYLICSKQIHLFGCLYYTYGTLLTAFRLLDTLRQRIDFHKLVTHRFSLERSQQAMEAARDHACLKGAVVP